MGVSVPGMVRCLSITTEWLWTEGPPRTGGDWVLAPYQWFVVTPPHTERESAGYKRCGDGSVLVGRKNGEATASAVTLGISGKPLACSCFTATERIAYGY